MQNLVFPLGMIYVVYSIYIVVHWNAQTGPDSSFACTNRSCIIQMKMIPLSL